MKRARAAAPNRRAIGGALPVALAVAIAACTDSTAPQPPITSVSVTPAHDTILVGQLVSLTAITRDASGNALIGRRVTWASADTQVATVSDSGLVTGRGAGAATITATSEHQVGVAVMTVKPVPVNSVVVEPGTVGLGLTAQLKASALDSVGHLLLDRPISWASLDTTIATVSTAGVATGVAVGTARVTATSEGKTGSAAVTVAVVPVASVTITPARDSVQAGSFASFTATTRDSAGRVLLGRSINWASSDTTVARIDGTSHDDAGRSVGLVFGVRAGSATITGTSEGKRAAATLKVLVVAVSLMIVPSETTVVAGSTLQLTATLRDSAGNVLDRPLIWSGGGEVAQLEQTGPQTARVTALIAGQATVYANQNGVEPIGSSNIRVVGTGLVASVSVTPAVTVVFVGSSVQLTATLRSADSGILTGLPVIWAVKSPTLLSVTQSGLVTGLAPTGGLYADTRVTATSEGVQGDADVNVASANATIIIEIVSGGTTLQVGGSVQLKAAVTDPGIEYAGGEFAWSSSDPAVASVSASGLVTARALGPATVTATIQGRSGSVPITVASFVALALREISVGGNHACGVAPDGAAYCWGSNGAGQLGHGSATYTAEPVPLPVTGGLSFTHLSAGSGFSCGLTAAGAAFCWGNNYIGQNGTSQPGLNLAPVAVSGGLPFVALSAGSAHACGLTASGEAYCWGDNEARQLGVDTTDSNCWEGEFLYGQCSFIPLRVSGGLTFAIISAGAYHTCGITTEQALYCWGLGDAVGVDSVPGTCSVGDYADPYPCSAAPVRVRDDLRFIAVAAGSRHTCALADDSLAYCWGSQSYDGSIGDGTFMGSPTPVAVTGGLHYEAIATGGDHSCGIATGGTAFCWGRGPSLGDGVGSDQAVPTAVAGSSAFASISAGYASSCAIARGASVAYCWGLNDYGQLGDGTTSARLTPIKVIVPAGP